MQPFWEHLNYSLNHLKSLFSYTPETQAVADGATNLYLAQVKSGFLKGIQGSGLIADISRFFYAVNWNQYWIQALLASHVLTFFVILLTKDRHSFLIGLLVILILLAASSEHVNRLGDLYWDNFSVANYFDSHGFFILIVYAIPIICNASLILIILLTQVAQLLVRAKRLELQTPTPSRPKQKLH